MQINRYGIIFIFWNIFLALLPCWTMYFLTAAQTRHDASLQSKKSISFWLIFLFWFFMLPNTAYLFFMVRHLVDYCHQYDAFRVCAKGSWTVLFFFVYALIGLPTFYYSLKKMTNLMGHRYGHRIKIVFPLLIIPMTSIGLLFGLYERFNSWDIFTKPWQLLEIAANYFRTPFLRTDFIAFTILLYAIYYGTDFLIRRKTS